MADGRDPSRHPFDFDADWTDSGGPPANRMPAVDDTLLRGQRFLERPRAAAVRRGGETTVVEIPSPARRGQTLSWCALALAVLSALVLSVGVYLTLATIDLSMHPLKNAAAWSWVAVGGLCGLVLALVGGGVAVARSRPRGVAVGAILASVVLPVLGVLIGAKLGVDALASNMATRAEELSTTAAGALQVTLEQNGVHVGPLLQLLLNLLG